MFGGSIQKYVDAGDYKSTFWSMFGIVCVVMVAVFVTAQQLGINSAKLEVSMFFSLAFLLFFFLADT